MDGLLTEYVSMWKRWNDFEGKSNVREFWMAWLINFAISILLTFFGRYIGIIGTIDYIYSFAILIPSIALGIRRFHDVGKSGWNFLWVFTIIGVLYMIYLWIQPSK